MTTSAQSPGPNHAGPSSTGAPAEDAGDADATMGRLSVDDAERFAAQFRPSWESTDGGWPPDGDDAPAEASIEAAAPEPRPEPVAGPSETAPETVAEPEPAAVAVIPAAATVAPEPTPEPSVIVQSEPPHARGAAEASVGVAPVLAEPSVIIAPESIAPPAPVPVRPRRVTNPSAFDAIPPDPTLPSNSKRWMIYGASASAALIVVTGVALSLGGSGDADVEPVASSAAGATPRAQDLDQGSPAGGATTEGADGPANEEASEVSVSIRTEPPDARLTVDGELVDNPYEASTTPSGTHTIVATAIGFEGSTESVSFGEDVELTLRLDALEPTPAPAQPPPAPAVNTPRPPTMATGRSTMRGTSQSGRPRTGRTGRMGMGRMSMGFTSTNPY